MRTDSICALSTSELPPIGSYRVRVVSLSAVLCLGANGAIFELNLKLDEMVAFSQEMIVKMVGEWSYGDGG